MIQRALLFIGRCALVVILSALLHSAILFVGVRKIIQRLWGVE